MKVLVAPCEFKETLTPKEAAEAVEKAFGDAGLLSLLHPVADGGGGTLNALQYNLKGKTKWYKVHDPLLREVEAPIFYYNDFAFIEMASASGLKLLKDEERDPLNLTSIGTGELIKHAVSEGYKKIYIGIGGSATVDGGIGALYALGIRFLDKNGKELEPVGRALFSIDSLEIPRKTLSLLKNADIRILSDVKNPLLGKNGAVRVFGPQKGLKEKYFEKMEKGLEKLAEIIYRKTGRDMRKIKGGGAAGGIGAALYGVFGAKIEDGAEFFLKITNFEDKLKDVDVVITGEGSFDEQSLFGKAPYKVAEISKKHGKKVIVLCGVAKVNESIYNVVDAVFSIVNGIQSKEEAFRKAKENLYFTAYNVARLLKEGVKS